jgi:light-regulated signal transduction histidine kinase (bacteriophytochrome)
LIVESEATITHCPLPTIPVQKMHLGLVLQNLISNAIRYRSEAAPAIRVEAIERGKFWVFSVADNGIGIEPQYSDLIFGVFKRLHSYDRHPGSGIGLATCRRIVAQWGGEVWLESSAPGMGSTFCFSIPAVPAHR